MIRCQCGMTIVKIGGGEIACRRCGNVVDVPADSHTITTCVHRGDVVGVAKCECAGLPKVFVCKIHKLAMQRKLKPGRVRIEIDGEKSLVEMAYCNACDHSEAKISDRTASI